MFFTAASSTSKRTPGETRLALNSLEKGSPMRRREIRDNMLQIAVQLPNSFNWGILYDCGKTHAYMYDKHE